jgi:hypothetical protein
MAPSLSGNSSAQGDGVGHHMGADHYESFVVRVLVGIDGDIARGQVTHVGSGERLHFTKPEHVPDLMRRLAISSAARRGPATR